MTRVRHFLAGLDTAVTTSAVPFGLTVTVWCTGAFLIYSHSPPTAGQVALFAAGSALAYALLRGTVALVESDPTFEIGRSPHWVRAGLVHLASIATALAAAGFIAQANTGAAWALAPFAAIALYLIVSSVEMALLHAQGAGGES